MANYSPQDILNNFSIEKKEYSIQNINQGFINDTFLILDNNEPQYILQRINTKVFENVEGVMGNIKKALDYLIDADYARITLVKTTSANSFFIDQSGGCWRLMTYIDNTTAYDTTANENIAYEAGRIIGKFHTLLEPASLEDFVDTIPHFHSLKLRESQFAEALTRTSSPRKKIAESAIRFVQELLPKLKATDLKELPVRICHNDTKLNNILFSKNTHKALCLIDLDTLMKGYFHCDFGDAVRTIVNTAPEDEKEHHKITFERNLFEAFVDGLKTNADLLGRQEIEILPYGVILMPFLHGIRALTDFLNGNIYYKVTYENQNLDRCLSLFSFTQKALDEMDYIKAILAKKFNG